MNVLYFYLFILVHPYLSMWVNSFKQAGRQPWEALIPGYNYYVAFKIGVFIKPINPGISVSDAHSV